ncbi:MAG: hypothetical protein O3A40_06770 [Bacteroidetes bacterium]|nr:hypothetical protein [Bacteroidota bacterium]
MSKVHLSIIYALLALCLSLVLLAVFSGDNGIFAMKLDFNSSSRVQKDSIALFGLR